MLGVKKMKKVLMIIFGLGLTFHLSAKESIRGHYEIVGDLPSSHSLKKVVFEEFMNFGCPHCNSLHKASKEFRKKFADKIDFIDVPIVFRGQDDAPLRLYYVAKKIGKGELIKDALFEASFTNGVNVFDSGITNYLARSLGMSREFNDEKDKLWVDNLIKEGETKSRIYQVRGTPTVVIQSALKIDLRAYGSLKVFVEKIPETIVDLLQ